MVQNLPESLTWRDELVHAFVNHCEGGPLRHGAGKSAGKGETVEPVEFGAKLASGDLERAQAAHRRGGKRAQ